jgi:peptidyl-tRNA hydrolase
MLAKPQLFMNVSGPRCGAAREAQDGGPMGGGLGRVESAVGRIEDPEEGSAGGHNGAESLIRVWEREFVRVRLGIHPGHPLADGASIAGRQALQKKEWTNSPGKRPTRLFP